MVLDQMQVKFSPNKSEVLVFLWSINLHFKVRSKKTNLAHKGIK